MPQNPLFGPDNPRRPRRRRGTVAVPTAASPTASTEFAGLIVEWMPNAGPSTTDGTWEDLVPYLTSVSVSRGRNVELDRFEAGTLTLELKSSTRLFDPDNAAGAYYGKLIPLRQIRVAAMWAGTRYPIFRGYVQSWGSTVPTADNLFVTTIVAKDAFLPLEKRKLPSSAWALEIVKDNPSGWFRLGESNTARVTDSSPNGNYGVYDNCEQGQEGLVVNDSDGAVTFAHSLEERVTIQNPNLITGYPFAVSAMIRIGPEDPGGAKTIFAGYPGSPTSVISPGIWWGIGSAYPGTLYARVYDGSATRTVISNSQYDDGQPHHVVWIATDASTHSFYVDGVQVSAVSSGGAPAWPGAPTNGFTIGNITDIGGGDYGFGNNDSGQSAASLAQGGWYVTSSRGTIDEVVVWNGTTPGADRIAAHAAAALTGWADDDTGTRVTRFLNAIGWPAELRDVDPGISILGPASWSTGSSPLSVLQSWADTEFGQFFIGRNGELVWRSRHYPLLDFASVRSNLTIGDGRSGETVVYDAAGFELVRDENLIRNPVQASRQNGVTVTVSDDTLVATYGDNTWSSPTTEDRDDASVRDRASWLLARYKNLSTRIQSLQISPRRDPQNLWPQVLGREIGDRITVNRKPLGIGSTISLDQIIERVEHKITPTSWTTQWSCSPVDPNVGSYMILDDATYGLLDSGLLAY